MKGKRALKERILIAMICLPFLLSSCLKYTPGKDTVLSVGDGRFQVLHGTSFKEDEGTAYFLCDMENALSECQVQKYYDDKRDKKLYLICRDGYIIVNYKIDSYEQHERIENFIEADQVVFYDESKFTTFGQQ